MGTFSHYSRESYSLQASGIPLGFMAMADIYFNLWDLTRLRTLIVQVIFVILEIRYTYYSIEARVLPFLYAPTSCPVSLTIILVKVKNKITNLKTHLPSRLHPTRSWNKEQTVKDSFTITIPSLAVEQTQNSKTKFLKTLLITDNKTVGLPSKPS